MGDRPGSLENVGVNRSFWQGKRVLVTGHTGFKGSWLALWLESLGAAVSGIALPAEQEEGAFNALRPSLDSRHADLRDEQEIARLFQDLNPEIVFHLAAQSLVRRSYDDPVATYETNVLGTLHLLRAAASVKTTVISTTDKVYRNDETGRAFVEDDPLGGSDPYSSSKACVELLAESWRRSFVIGSDHRVGTARAGNVIGGGDWGTDRLVPDTLRSLDAGRPVRLRYPKAVRPWQFVLEPLLGYLMFAEGLHTDPAAPDVLNFGPGPDAWATVEEVVQQMLAAWGSGSLEHADESFAPESQILALDSTRAEKQLGWRNRLDLASTLGWTVAWRKEQLSGSDMREFSLTQIKAFEEMT